MSIQDQASNPLTTPASGQMLGYTQPTPEAEALSLRIYNFLLSSIREEDKQNGQLFLKRFLDGPQSVWNQTQSNIFALKNLWNVETIPDEFLQYLQWIVGWTSELSHITDELDFLTLRRLIGASGQLWKERGPENALEDVERLVTGARLRVLNWFDYRWVVDETGTSPEHDGLDPWMSSGEGLAEYEFNLRIVDNGSLNRTLVKNLAKLMRPSGERIEITYLALIDLFRVDDDNSQWDVSAGSLNVLSGIATLVDATDEAAVCIAQDVDEDAVLVTARVKGDSPCTPVVLANCLDSDNYYAWGYGTGQILYLYKKSSGILSILGSSGAPSTLGVGQTVPADLWFELKLHLAHEGSDTRLIGYIDGIEVVNILDSSSPLASGGSVGFGRMDGSGDMYVDEIEAIGLPSDTDYVDINS